MISVSDPRSMLHHANVDRLWAYWQAIHPEEDIFQDSYEGGSRYSTPQDTVITPDSPLEPFFQADGTFHTTRSVRSIQGFGYTYPELEYWAKSEEQLREDARSLINRLYSGDGAKRDTRRDDGTRYFASIQLDVTEVERPCLVEVYIDDVKAGSLVVMGQPEIGVVHGDIPLNDALEALGKRGTDADATVSSIQDLLSVAIAKVRFLTPSLGEYTLTKDPAGWNKDGSGGGAQPQSRDRGRGGKARALEQRLPKLRHPAPPPSPDLPKSRAIRRAG